MLILHFARGRAWHDHAPFAEFHLQPHARWNTLERCRRDDSELIRSAGYQSINESVTREPKTITVNGVTSHHRIVGISDLRDNTGNWSFTLSKI
jgi:hypothetical protein